MKNMGFGKKLLMILVPMVVLAIGGITWISFMMSKDIIMEQQSDNMGQLVTKTIQTLGIWMDDRIKDSMIFSKTGVFIDACQGRRLEDCRKRLETYHDLAPLYENIFVALPTGEVIMDALGDKSKGINISQIPEYAMNMKKAHEGASWISQAAASPITGRPVSLVTSPIYDGNRLVGVMGTPVEINSFSDVFVGSVKIGQNGYLFLADGSGQVVAHPNKDLIMKINMKDTDFASAMLAQKRGSIQYIWQGKKRISFFDTFDKSHWMVVASADVDEFLEPVVSVRNYSLLLGLAAVLLLSFSAWRRARSITRPLKTTVASLNDIAQGDLAQDVEASHLARGDEIGLLARGLQQVITAQRKRVAMAQAIAQGRLDIEVVQASDRDTLGKALKDMVASLGGLIHNTNLAIEQVASGAREVSDSSQSLSQGATEQAASLEEITSSMTELGAQTLTNAENAGQANNLGQKARQSAEAGNRQMKDMIEAMGGINQASREIAKIIKTIDDIAFQTNLLALNAAVEAARAGKHGKGFAVVAQEVRSLAGRSGKAARETAELIEGTVRKVQNGAEILDHTEASLSEIVEGIAKVTDLVEEIAAASNEQAQGITQVNQGLSQVEKVTQQNTATAEESASAADELSAQAARLKELMLRFRLAEQKASTARPPQAATQSRRPPTPKRIGPGSEASIQGKRSRRPKDLIALEDDFGKY